MKEITPTTSKFKRRKWLIISLGLVAIFGLLFVLWFLVVAYSYCKPRHNLAQAVDLKKLDASAPWVPLTEIPEYYVNALIAVEDPRFFSHDGVELNEIMKVVWLNYRAKEAQNGADTLTRQLVRKVFRDELRQTLVLEFFLACRIEREFGKKKILELHIHHTDFGHDYHGIAAAAHGYFGKNPESLSLIEAATLAGLIRNPHYGSPRLYPASAKKARDHVLTVMKEYGYIDFETMARAQQAPVKVK